MDEAARKARGTRLRDEREKRCLSRVDLARLLLRAMPEDDRQRQDAIAMSKYIGRWENGKVDISARYRRAYIEALELDSNDLFGPQAPDAALDAYSELSNNANSGFPLVVSSHRHKGPVIPELVDYFRGQLSGHYQADMMLGPLALIGTLTAQVELIDDLLAIADGITRKRLTEVGTAFRAFTGWLYLDAGDIASALRWQSAALELAHRSGNRDAVACSLVDLAMSYTDRGDGGAVTDLCTNALSEESKLNPEVQVFALQQQAHGESISTSADRADVDRSLDRALQVIRRVDSEEWGTACLRTPNYVEIQRATCYGNLGLFEESHKLWEQLIPPDTGLARRDVGVWKARHAITRAKAGNPDHAIDIAREAVSIAVGTGSARARKELSRLDSEMRPWRDSSLGREFAEILIPLKIEA